MGATLTLLIRYLLGASTDRAGWSVGLLYGFNTLGAALGCVVIDNLAIPQLGLTASKMIAVCLNLIAALLATRLLKTATPATVPHTNVQPGPSVFSVFKSGIQPSYVGVAIFLSGFGAMGFEIVWFRYLSSVLGAQRETFSMLLMVVLIGIWLGALLAGNLSKRTKTPAALYAFAQIAMVVTALACLWMYTHLDRFAFVAIFTDTLPPGSANAQYQFLAYCGYLSTIFFVVFLPTVFMGAAFPLANAIVQQDTTLVGARAGHIYLWNSLGAVFGANAAGFLLLPSLGMRASIIALACVSLLAVIPLIQIEKHAWNRFPRQKWATIFAMATAVWLIGAWLRMEPQHMILSTFLSDPLEASDTRAIASSEGLLETILVSQGDGGRRLFTNGYPMSTTNYSARRYMKLFAHIPLLQMEAPQRALIICFGVGNTVNAVSKHPSITDIEVADISKHILSQAHYFKQWNENILTDERVSVFINDGRQHLRMRPLEHYDLVTLEPPPLSVAGVASLYSVEFYRLVKARLKPGGFISQWWPLYQLGIDESKSMVAAFLEVFPNAVLLSGSAREFILLGQTDGDNELDPDLVAKNIRLRPAVKNDLDEIDFSSLTDFVGSFVADRHVLAFAVRGATPVSDNYPSMEYSGKVYNVVLPKAFFETPSVTTWCPKCFDGSKPRADMPDLIGYLGIQQSFYWSEWFRTNGAEVDPDQLGPMEFIPSADTVRHLWQTYPFFRQQYRFVWKQE